MGGVCGPCPANRCCIGSAVIASGALAPKEPCKSCQPLKAIHDYTARFDGNDCDDGDVCNGLSTCGGGVCTQTQAATACTSAPVCHAVHSATCAGGTGLCTYPSLPDGTNGCAAGQTCVGGTCAARCVIGGSVFDAGALSSMNSCQRCQPATSTGAWTDVGNGTGCSDGNACTKNDVCTSGTCGGTAYSCTPSACQQTSTCNGSGGCTIVNKANGAGCPGGSCTNGCCVTSCSAAPPACGQVTSGTDNCGNACSKNGGACTDPCNNMCGGGEYCLGSGCCSVYPTCQPFGTICYGPCDCCGGQCNFNSCQS